MSFDYSTLVTDRTEADADAWSGKGTYDYTDLNRVTAAMEDLQARFVACGYQTGFQMVRIRHPDGTVSTVWREEDEDIRFAKIEMYRSNVAALRAALTVLETTPAAPETMEFLNWSKANNIEQILKDMDLLLRNMAEAWFYSGDLFSGEV